MNRPITNSKPTEQAERCRTLSTEKRLYELQSNAR